MWIFDRDKAGHALVGAFIASAAAALMVLTPHAAWAWAAAIGAAFVAGFAKELRDDRANDAAERQGLPPPHAVEGRDLAATTIGGLCVAAPLAVLTLRAAGVL